MTTPSERVFTRTFFVSTFFFGRKESDNIGWHWDKQPQLPDIAPSWLGVRDVSKEFHNRHNARCSSFITLDSAPGFPQTLTSWWICFKVSTFKAQMLYCLQSSAQYPTLTALSTTNFRSEIFVKIRFPLFFRGFADFLPLALSGVSSANSTISNLQNRLRRLVYSAIPSLRYFSLF